MSKIEDNKAIVGRWFTEFWGKTCNLGIVDELAAPDMLLQYSLHAPRRGREDIKAFMSGFREAFPDLSFWGAADLIAEGDHVVGRWEGGGTHTGPAFDDFLVGSLPAASGRKMRFTGTTVLRIEDGRIAEEVGLDDGVTALQQLGLIRAVDSSGSDLYFFVDRGWAASAVRFASERDYVADFRWRGAADDIGSGSSGRWLHWRRVILHSENPRRSPDHRSLATSHSSWGLSRLRRENGRDHTIVFRRRRGAVGRHQHLGYFHIRAAMPCSSAPRALA